MKKEEPIVRTIPTSDLQISEFNVRKERDSEKITELAKSIEEQGILQPLLVRPENSHYGIIIGSRRFTAAKKANLKNIPVIVKDLGDQESRIVSLIENLQRNDLTPKETTEALNILNETISSRDLAIKLGKSQTYISRMVTVEQTLLKLDRIGVTVKLNPKESERLSKKAIPLEHVVRIAQAFNGPELKPILEKDPNKDVEVAMAVINVTDLNMDKVLREFKKHPEDNIEHIVQQAEMGLLDEPDRGHASDYLGERGDDKIDISHYEFQINYHSGEVSHYLSNIRNLPTATDDVEVDFIRKSREFRKMLISELSSTSRAGIHSRLNYLSKLIEETLEEIEKAQK